MRSAVLCCVYLLASVVASHTVAQDPLDVDAMRAAVQAADDARIAAMRSPDRQKLDAIFSDQLRYAHSNGVVDTKESLTEVLLSGKTKYIAFDYQERKINILVPGIALMAGRVRVEVESAGGKMDSVLSYLAVWREENGQWRFRAWQSCKIPPAANP